MVEMEQEVQVVVEAQVVNHVLLEVMVLTFLLHLLRVLEVVEVRG